MGPITEPPGLGSSPHARGTRAAPLSGRWPPQFIPAYAGNAGPVTVLAWPPTVHPRMRGERGNGPRGPSWTDGSSPHARGTLFPRPALSRLGRFIPACAGNAVRHHYNRCRQAVHPRMRGERITALAVPAGPVGSSPHARGTLETVAGDVDRMRFIPACAGNAMTTAYDPRNRAVHPRMRGERQALALQPKPITGSSPHARGTPSPYTTPTATHRFIPACAGNARARTAHAGGVTVHPRMRGERCTYCQHALAHAGSSPHARGTPARPGRPSGPCRFIPACAGNAAPYRPSGSSPAVHPRMRGERAGGVVGKCLIPRFIPACAGNAAADHP